MPLYAYGEEGEIVHATDARRGERYACVECGAPLQIRRGRYRFPHFYHLAASERCRLYSKSEDHLLLQLQLQRLLPPGETALERSFSPINRIADLYWEKQRAVFEIQCSALSCEEVEQRTADYAKVQCALIWLLDDRLFNRRWVRPAEALLRARGAYYVSFERQLPQSFYYDQFEIIAESKRLKRGRPLSVHLDRLYCVPNIEWPSALPSCVTRRLASHPPRYVRGDLIDRTLSASLYPSYALAFARWHQLEATCLQAPSLLARGKRLWRRYVAHPYRRMLEKALARLP